jgi:hypothetical protein
MGKQIVLMEAVETRTLMSASAVHDVTHRTDKGKDGGSNPPPPPPTLTVPAKPTNLAATASGQTVSLTWKDNSTNETGFIVYRIVKGALTSVGTVGANVTAFSDTAAPVGQDVYVVRATNSKGNSEGSNAVTVTIAAPVALTAPRVLKTVAISTTSIAVSWDKDAGATGGYLVERSLDGKSGWTTVGTTAAGVRTVTDTGLTAATKYFYRVTARGDGGRTAVSAVIQGLTKRSDSGEPPKSTGGSTGTAGRK